MTPVAAPGPRRARPRTRPARPTSRWLSLLLLPSLALALVALLLAPAAPARADSTVSPRSGAFSIEGRGHGHGHGMSQWGAYGAARAGLDWREIMAFYYPGTQVATTDVGWLRVWLSGDTDASLTVLPERGLRVYEVGGSRKSVTLPVGSSAAQWRIRHVSKGFQLEQRSAGGSWRARDVGLSPRQNWRVAAADETVSVVMPNSAVTEYRGRVGLVRAGSSAKTVNAVRLEDYLRGVVPKEMPTSWSPEAVRSQAVAARTYALYLNARGSTGQGYELCDTVSCQVYRGVATTSGGQRVVHETSGGDAAVAATAGRMLNYRGKPALTQFSASNGGQSVASTLPYLTAQPDPYDGAVTSQAWKTSVTTAKLSQTWPQLGTVKAIRITQRDGEGSSWGGRATTVRITGSKSTVTTSGTNFRHRLGLRSTYFVIR